jgi:hypothetical protein
LNRSLITEWLSVLTNLGVLIGVALLVVELNQNAELMRAEIHALRAEAKVDRQMSMANSGEMVRIMQLAYSAGFPTDSQGLNVLNAEERFRLAAFIAGLKEAVGNWHYQCQKGMLDDELCRSGYRAQVRNLTLMSHAMSIELTDVRESFLADIRKIASEEGLPIPNEDGSW